MTSVSDCRVSQVVNVKKGIHCLNPKNARDKEDMERPTKETSKYLRLARQGRRSEQGDERRLDGHDQVARVGEEARPARCLWARQRGDGLPGRRDLRHREECPLPDAEEHLGRRPASANRRHGRVAPRGPSLHVTIHGVALALSSRAWLALAVAGICAGAHPGCDHHDRSAQPDRGRGRRPDRGGQSRPAEHGCRGLSAQAAGRPAAQECAHARARRARLRSVGRSPAGAGRQTARSAAAAPAMSMPRLPSRCWSFAG